ncbi:MAG: ATP-dependent sacrificial sulfur transferase LarE, partial [Deltaproteobacteria bacterium]|nr:ATP-dependent sacrificial sulfur transferase LarE [Deltaproteobacteria bacterium]
ELAQAEALAQGLGLAHRVIQTGEMNLPAYRENSADRCYHCKTTLYADLASLAVREGYAVVLSGTHVGDLADHRPGLQAAKKYGVRSPLAECGLDKTQVRLLAQTLGLPNAHKPQAACLASRLPFGRGVSPQGLAQVEQAEEALLALGFTQVRVRHHGPVARVEIPLEQLALALAVREQLVAGVKQAGFGFVALDLDGFRSGSLNP